MRFRGDTSKCFLLAFSLRCLGGTIAEHTISKKKKDNYRAGKARKTAVVLKHGSLSELAEEFKIREHLDSTLRLIALEVGECMVSSVGVFQKFFRVRVKATYRSIIYIDISPIVSQLQHRSTITTVLF